jgi:hypothetical protein
MSGPAHPGPRWPHDRWISPTVLKTYQLCPQQVKFGYLDQLPKSWGFRPAISKGNATHLALKRIADALARGRAPIDESDVEKMARLFLPRREFPSEDEWNAHLKDISLWVQRGRAHIERESVRDWVLVERPLKRSWNLFRGVLPYTITARPDVVMHHDDEDNQPVIEFVDYKTGKERFDEMPALVLRLVARELLERLVQNVDDAQVRFTYLWLSTGEQDTITLTPEYIEYYREQIERQMRKLASETEWAPRPSRACRYCPFYQNVCPEQIPRDDVISRPDGFGPSAIY